MSDGQLTTGTLGHRAARGAMLGSFAAVIDRINALGVQAALTYILLKSDFGIWALASPIVALSTMLVQTAVRDVLIHRGDRFHLWSSPAVWLSGVLGLIAGVGVFLVGVGASIVYSSPEIVTVLLIACVQPIASGLTNVPRAKLSIDMRFGCLAAYFCVSSISSWILALIFALFGAGVYCFPLGISITGVGQVFAIWLIAPVKVRGRPEFGRWGFIFRDTKTVVASNFTKWARTQGDRLILGLFLTDGLLGVYFLAFQLSIQAFSVLTLNLSSVLLPALASLNSEPERQVRAFVRSLKMLLFLAAPVCAGTIVVASPVTRILFDEGKWERLDVVVQLISIGMVFRVIEPPVRSLMNARGRFSELFIVDAVSTVCFVCFLLGVMYWAGYFELEGSSLYAAALAGVVFHVFFALVLIRVALRGTGVAFIGALLELCEPLVFGLIGGVVAWAGVWLVGGSDAWEMDVVRIVVAGVLFVVVYGLIGHVRRPGEIGELAGFAIRVAPERLRGLVDRGFGVVFGYRAG